MKKPYKEKENYPIIYMTHPYEWENHPSNIVMKMYKDLMSGHVLDFGCGVGINSYLACEIDGVNRVTGLDINKDAIESAEKTKEFKGFGNYNVDFITGNVVDIKLDLTYDTIVSFQTIEHIYPEDIEDVLMKLRDSLEYGGYFITSIPYKRGFYDEAHVAFYDEITFKELFEKCGFKTINCFYQNELGAILTGVFKKE